MTDSKDKKTWFITGCSSGLGAALCRVALAAGHRVWATARDARALEPLAALGDCAALELDVTRPEQVRRAVRDAFTGGRVDVLVNNAGAAWLGALEDTDEAEISRCMAVNFHGPLAVMREAAPHLRAQGGGHVINISAAAAIANYPGFAIYGAAKAALEAASESFRAELTPFAVKVTLVQPGPFRTDFIGRSLHRTARQSDAYAATVGRFAALLEKMHGRQPGDPSRAAEAILRMVAAGAAPSRLTLGAYATKKARETAEQRLRELAANESFSNGTEFAP
jgi:NAD(P)-dependent dehydrogenase (short-subunit alcohol dehydrogenase family)